MSLRLAESTFELREHQVLPLNDPVGFSVTCLAGAVWITQAEDADDIVLKPGQDFVFDRPGLALVSAPVGAASVLLRPIRSAMPRRIPQARDSALRPAA